MPAFVRANVTATYHPASIDAAVMLNSPVDAQPIFFSTKWLNIAKKNSAILGLRIEIKKPSTAPCIKVFEEALSGEVLLPLGPGFPEMIRKPIYDTRHAPNS